MPYTPPTSRSPASSNPNSPILSRNHSYDAVSQSNRPGLPRSRSAQYLQKHRRTPSISDHQTTSHHGLHTVTAGNGTTGNAYRSTSGHSSTVPRGFTPDFQIGSPSGSSATSEEDDETGRGRKIEDLAASLKNSMVVSKRAASPERTEEDNQPAAPKPTPLVLTTGTVSPALTPEARKIAHSRSSSDINFSNFLEVPSQAASSDESDDEDLEIKPPLLRKKSGELVKPALRPPSRRRPSSMPGTPTYSKAVHFNEDIEQVRHFLQVDRPIAVSAGSSPVETYDSESEYPFGYDDGYKSTHVEWEIRTSNFPRDSLERQSLPVRVEKIFLSADSKNLIGVVAVANIAFHKLVVARFTLDYWKTTSEIVAEYNNDVRKKRSNDGYDQFNFNIKLSDQAHLESKTLLLCVRYNVNGQEFWDNNNMMNYQVDFIKKVVPRKTKQGSGAGTLGAIPRSRHSPMVRPRSFPSANDDDFAQGFEFGSGSMLENATQRSRGRKSSLYPTQQKRNQNGGAFATRYDFGASLSAALTQAQTQMSQVPTKQLPVATKTTSSAPAVQPVEGSGPGRISSDRPELGSQEYHDLIAKFCYFGSKQTSPGSSSPDQKTPTRSAYDASHQLSNLQQVEGTHSPVDLESDTSTLNSVSSSASSSPPSPRPTQLHLDGTNDSHRTSRSSTPSFHTTSPRLLAQYRSPSPALGHELPFPVLAQ